MNNMFENLTEPVDEPQIDAIPDPEAQTDKEKAIAMMKELKTMVIQELMDRDDMISERDCIIDEQSIIIEKQIDIINDKEKELRTLRAYIHELKINLSTFVCNYNRVKEAGKIRGQDNHSIEKSYSEKYDNDYLSGKMTGR